jgi:hypothetical protein
MPQKIRKSLETVIAQFTAKHGTTYDYSRVNYLGGHHKVEIICKQHGSFFQGPNDHINGSGCSKCSRNHRISQEEFVQRSEAVHGKTYDLSKAIYKASKQKVQVICKQHGDFFINPSDFWNGVGCKQCGFEKGQKVKIAKGLVKDPTTVDKFISYKRKVRKITDTNFKQYSHIVNPTNKTRSYDWHLDHKFSIFEGFQNNVPPEVVGHWANLTMIHRQPNQSKGIKCSLTLNELMALIESN